MVTFAGVAHVSFTVTDLDASQRFYTEVLDFVQVLDVGYGRIFMHPGTGFGRAKLGDQREDPSSQFDVILARAIRCASGSRHVRAAGCPSPPLGAPHRTRTK